MLSVNSLFDISSFIHRGLFDDCEFSWDGLKVLKQYMDSHSYPQLDANLAQSIVPLDETLILHQGEFYNGSEVTIIYGDATKGKLTVHKDGKLLTGASVIMAGAILAGDKISIGKGVLVEAGAMIKSPTIIGHMNEIRQGAYIRGYCLTGSGCVIGHVTEVKHTVFLNGAKAGHFAYLGDSILGNNVNLGAGTKLANLRFTEGSVPIKTPEGPIDSGLRKFGAILGDSVQTGCNSVTNPGSVLGKGSLVLPNKTVPSGYHENSSIIR